MAIKRLVLNRTSADPITEELVAALSNGEPIEFTDLFARTSEALKRRNIRTGTEEVLKLRCYDRLLKLAGNGLVEKNNRTFRARLAAGPASANGHAAAPKPAHHGRTSSPRSGAPAIPESNSPTAAP